MYQQLTRKNRSTSLKFWLVILFLVVTVSSGGPSLSGIGRLLVLAWSSDDDPDEGGQAA